MRSIEHAGSNLNAYRNPCDDIPSCEKEKYYKDNSIKDKVYFRNLKDHLIRHIEEAEAVVGCVAWITNHDIIDALAKKKVAMIAIQKEDFLRPDICNRQEWAKVLREDYSRLSAHYRYTFDNTMVCNSSICGDPGFDAVRCVGNYNFDKEATSPKMHNKFLVFGSIVINSDSDIEGTKDNREIGFSPTAVWTGSFNFTNNAIFSFENALYITDPEIVQAYYQEWGHIYAISEPLDWETPWVAPEWRIGT
jgi:phosphatidylserine/phosphatidylglycerophosphate/cardiolipin synthase-like enzyme